MTGGEDRATRSVQVGKVVGIHGLQGWLKVLSFTEPREAIFGYVPLRVGEEEIERFTGKAHGRGLLMKIHGRDDRNAVEALVGAPIKIHREQLPEAADGEYYHVDLIGLDVVNSANESLGRVEQVMGTGANDVLVVAGDRRRLIPFTIGHTVVDVDLDAGCIVVDWQTDWL
ncbi:MAG: ribosome maturation factor RimM [Xanthomonadales bacterium]|nr:ribosome maturation factor RimM [Xanthomonadales bacterium]